MKCLTLAVAREFIPGMDTFPGMFYVRKDAEVREGIEANFDALAVVLDGDNRVGINSRRFATARSDFRQEEGKLTILRASVEVGPTGSLELVPERSDDKEGCLLFLDLGKGAYTGVRYQTMAGYVVARGVSNHALAPEPEETLLARLNPGQSIWALRTTRRWMWWGEEQVRERLAVCFNGTDVVVHKLAA